MRIKITLQCIEDHDDNISFSLKHDSDTVSIDCIGECVIINKEELKLAVSKL